MWCAKALPSFVLIGTKTISLFIPMTTTDPSNLTRALGYQAGPLTSLTAVVGVGEAVMTRCC